MEKYAERFRTDFPRLLIFVLLVAYAFPVFAKPVSWNYLWSLRFRQSQETLFTETDNSFYVEIEGVTPDSIQLAVNSLPHNVSFISSKKETVMIKSGNGQNEKYSAGTRITIWMKFLKTGFYKISPIDLVINGSFYQIPFNPVEVFENPKFINPQVSVSFNNLNISSKGKTAEAYEGQHIVFTVNVKYANSVKNVSWNIPEDSVFKKLREFNSSDEDFFSTEFKPIAVFDWQPLKSGNWNLPEIFVTAVSYNGTINDIKCPPISFKVHEKKSVVNKPKQESPFAYAFIEQPSSYDKNVSRPEAKNYDILNLIELHKKERHSIPFFNSAFKERRQIELSVGLSPSGVEPSVVFFTIMFCAVFILLAVSVLLFIFKRKKTCAIFVSMFVTFAVFLSIYGYHLFTSRGIYAGGTMSPIPEKTAPTGVTIQAGSVVSIIRTAGGWMYIRHNDTYGWVSAENVYIIK